MSNRIAVTEQQKELALFFSKKILDVYSKIDPNFSRNDDSKDVIADALLHEYFGTEWKPSVAATVSGVVSNATGANGTIVLVESNDSTSILKKDFTVPPAINVHIEVTNPSDGEYVLDISANIFGYGVGGLALHFKKGELSTNNKYLSPLIDIWYRASINFKNGAHIEFEADVKPIAIDKFHIGPLNLDI